MLKRFLFTLTIAYVVAVSFLGLDPTYVYANPTKELVQKSSTDINGDFEVDLNNNGLPDFWENNWRNGTSQGPYATLAPYEPVTGKYHYRIYNGVGDASSYQYVLSDPIPVSAGKPYTLNASLRYTLPVGRAEMSVIQIDSNGNNAGEIHYVYNNGGWKWNAKSEQFVTNPNVTSIRIRFGIGGEISAYLDIDQVSLTKFDMNNDFEKDVNGNNIPDFWETQWRNGTSKNPFAQSAPYVPVSGKYHYRLNNGTDDANSYQYALSDPIPVVGHAAYELKSWLRYTLPVGRAEMSIIQFDSNGNNVGEVHFAYNNGGWKWSLKEEYFVTNPNVTSVRIRFGIGGEISAYLDIDQVDLNLINTEGSLEFLEKRYRYHYDENGRITKVNKPNGEIFEYEYDKNGNLLRKKIRR